jgi:putative two-component system response regulator
LKQQQSDGESLQRTQDLVRTRDAVIFGLAKLAESRDPDTGQHLERISHYSTRLASALRRHPRYRDAVTPAFVRLIGISSALHDIGKVGVEDAILLKPDKLTADERARMQEHTLAAGECLKEIERRLAASNFLQMAREIALYHHEWWNGSGYPARLAGEQIPLAARIVAIADVYDALSVRRVYKEALSHRTCVAMIQAEAGTHFDPHLVEVFLQIEPQFQEIARQFADSSNEVREPQSRTSVEAMNSRAAEAVLPENKKPKMRRRDRMTATEEAILVSVLEAPAPITRPQTATSPT